MKNLEVVWLRSLASVAAYSGITNAATALNLTKAAVSLHIKKLERQVGCPLVTKVGRGIALTADGELLADYAQQILELHDAALQDLQPPGGTDLVVAATEHAAEFLVPELIRTLRLVSPEHAIRIRLTRSAKASDLFRLRRADVALFLHDPHNEATHVGDLPLEWVGAKGNGGGVTGGGASGVHRIVVFERPCAVRDHALSTLERDSYTVVRECVNMAKVVSSVREGKGITPLPRSGPLGRGSGLQLVPGMPALPSVPLYLTTSSRISAAARRELVTAMRARVGG